MPFDLPPLPPVTPAFEVVMSTDNISKGTSKTGGDTSYTASLRLDTAEPVVGSARAFAGISSERVDLASGADQELQVFGGLKGDVAGVAVTGSVTHKTFLGTADGIDSNMVELGATAAKDFGRIKTKLVVQYTPNEYGPGKEATWVEGRIATDLRPGTEVSAGLGRRFQTVLNDYNAFNVGLTQTLPLGLAVDVRYYNTNAGQLNGFYRGGDRTVVSLISRF